MNARISSSELEVMRALWAAGRPMTMPEIRRAVRLATGWEDSTVKTLVSRLVAKGAVTQEKRELYLYSPAVGREEYGLGAVKSLIDRVYGGSAGNLVTALVDSGLSGEELAELRAMLNNGGGDE